MSTKPALLIVGATGNNGKATIKSLLSGKSRDMFAIRAAIRDEEKGNALIEMFPGIETAMNL